MRGNPTMIVTVLFAGLVAVSCVTERNGMEPAAQAANQTAAQKQGRSGGGAGAASLAGEWSGAIIAAGETIDIHLHFGESGGKWEGTIDIPEQNAWGFSLIDLRFEPPKLSFVLRAGSDNAQFAGSVAGDRITGSFRQGPVAGTFAVARSPGQPAGPAGPALREGTPIELETPTGTIFGTLDLPSGRGPFPVVLIVAGSGPTDRNGNSPLLPGSNDSLQILARVLRERGIASVRYDKRGVGQSAAAMKSEVDLTFSTYVDDAAAWIDLLKHDPRFTKVGVIGHSEGSLVGMVAARVAGADAFVSIAGAGFPAAEVLKQQLAGQPEPLRSQAIAIVDSLQAGREVKDVPPELMPLFRPSVQPYLISWFRYDPRKEIARLTIPILILQGTHDLQVSVMDAEALHAAQPRSTLDLIAEMNHVLKLAPENRGQNIAAYSNPNLPLAPALVKDLTGFLASVL